MLKNKTARTVCGVIAFVMFFLALGTVGSMEHDLIPLGAGFVRTLVFEALFALFAKLAGAMN